MIFDVMKVNLGNFSKENFVKPFEIAKVGLDDQSHEITSTFNPPQVALILF